MKCPFCHTELISGEERKFENIADHAFDPNAEDYPLRPTFICPNNDCSCTGKKFWDGYGDFYGRTPKHLYGKVITSAIESPSRKFDVQCHIRSNKTNWIGKLIFWDKSGWKKYAAADNVAKLIMKLALYRLLGYEI